MPVAILSDIHGNLPALEAVIADAQTAGCRQFYNLGDSLSGPLWPAETAELLIARDWPAIAGNHERQLLAASECMGASDAFTIARLAPRHVEWIRSLPATIEAGDRLLCHGSPTSDIEHLLFTISTQGIAPASDVEIASRCRGTGARQIWCGHTHLPVARKLPDGRTIANPGGVGLQAFDDDRPHPYVVENGDPRARYAIADGLEITFRAVEYDHASAAAKAKREGFTDWARWLASGRF